MSAKNNRQEPALNTLRLPDGEAEHILDTCDEQNCAPGDKDHRTNARHRFRAEAGIMVAVCQPGGSVIRYTVMPRNLSTTGVAFLHGGFLHTGTSCLVSLPTLDAEWVNAIGQIVRCQHLRANIHEIGVLFRDPIDLDHFLSADGPESQTHDNCDLPKLVGQVLCIEDTSDDRDLIRYLLAKLDVKVTMASVDDATELLDSGAEYDLLLAAHRPPELDGLGSARTVRDKAPDLPIILLTADEDEGIHAEAAGVGCSCVLFKPFDSYTLASALQQHLPPAEATDQVRKTTVLHSLLWADKSIRPLILDYLVSLAEQADKLRDMLNDTAEPEALRSLCLQIKGSAGGYGYPQITHAAKHLLALHKASEPPEQLQSQLQTLVDLCKRAACALDEAAKESG